MKTRITQQGPSSAVHFIWGELTFVMWKHPRLQENKISLTLASKVREAPRLLGFFRNPRTSSKSQKRPFPFLLCPLGEIHSALDLDPPSYLPVPHSSGGGVRPGWGRAGQWGENEGELSPTPRA